MFRSVILLEHHSCIKPCRPLLDNQQKVQVKVQVMALTNHIENGAQNGSSVHRSHSSVQTDKGGSVPSHQQSGYEYAK